LTRKPAIWIAGAGLALAAGMAVRHESKARPARMAPGPLRRVVVLGAGFGGLQAALDLAEQPGIDLTVIDAHNHHLFQPLLYQVATAALSPSDIASPLRGIIPDSPRTRVLMATVDGIDTVGRTVICGGEPVPYDDLIIATGSQASYFGHPSWAATAPSLKNLDDALGLRNCILVAFERALHAATNVERDRLLTFVLIGGGPTGVEMAGSIAELSRDILAHDDDGMRSPARIILVDAADRVLSEFAPDLSADAAAALKSLGVTVRLGVKVTGIENGMVQLGDETLAAETVIWTAGTQATPVADWLGVKAGRGGRVVVNPTLQVAGHAGVRVIGDAALALDTDGKPLPGLAPVAKQQGRYVARAILRHARGGRQPAPFRYRDYGTLATIGRNKAVAEFGAIHLSGLPAWLMWAGAHIFFLIGFRNRFMVTAQWLFAYATHDRADRLIVERPERERGLASTRARPRSPQPPVAKPG